MSGQDELRDRIAKVHFASSARLAAEQFDLDKTDALASCGCTCHLEPTY